MIVIMMMTDKSSLVLVDVIIIKIFRLQVPHC